MFDKNNMTMTITTRKTEEKGFYKSRIFCECDKPHTDDFDNMVKWLYKNDMDHMIGFKNWDKTQMILFMHEKDAFILKMYFG